MAAGQFAVTVNGVALATVIENEIREEINLHQKKEITSLSRSAHSHIITRRMGNTSGRRSGRGRIIFSAVGTA